MALTQDKIFNILSKHGKTGVLRTYASETYDHIEGSVTRGATTDHTVTMLPLYTSFSAASKQMTFIEGNEDFKRAEAITLVAAKDLEFIPSLKQLLFDGTERWMVSGYMPLDYKTMTLAYALALKKSEGLKEDDL